MNQSREWRYPRSEKGGMILPCRSAHQQHQGYGREGIPFYNTEIKPVARTTLYLTGHQTFGDLLGAA